MLDIFIVLIPQLNKIIGIQMSQEKYSARVGSIAGMARNMHKLVIAPQFAGGLYIEDSAKRQENIMLAFQNDPMFEGVGEESLNLISSAWGSAIAESKAVNGGFPRQEILANAYQSTENFLTNNLSSKNSKIAQMFESVSGTMEQSEGIDIRAHTVALILPVLLSTVTNDAVTLIPTGNDEAEIFKIERVTGSDFGDFSKNTVIDGSNVGQYAHMRQRFPTKQAANNVLTTFTLTPKDDLKVAKDMPIKKGTVKIFVNRVLVGTDISKNGKIYGEIIGGETIDNASSTCDYATGAVSVTFSGALATGTSTHIEWEVDIEKDSSLIPSITHEMDSKIVRPFEFALSSDVTVQALWKGRRELSIDQSSMLLTGMRNVIAAEKAHRHLSDMRFHCVKEDTYDFKPTTGMNDEEHSHKFRVLLNKINQRFTTDTKVAGLRGFYLGKEVATHVMAMKDFKPSGVISDPAQPYFAGTFAGKYRVYVDPSTQDGDDSWEILTYARGSNHSQAGYIAGDTIPAIHFDHDTGKDLNMSDTLWGKHFAEIHPFDGADYFHRIKAAYTVS